MPALYFILHALRGITRAAISKVLLAGMVPSGQCKQRGSTRQKSAEIMSIKQLPVGKQNLERMKLRYI